MARLVVHDAKKPLEVKCAEPRWICMCGLSKNQPFCDGSHEATHDEKEGKLYAYENGKRIEVRG